MKVGDIVRLIGDKRIFRVREIFDDGFIKVNEVTEAYDKRALCRAIADFEII